MNQWVRMINDWFRPKLEGSENPSEQFKRLWNDQESGRSITFMSIAFGTSSMGDIKELGLSHWSKSGFQQQITHHWRVVEKVETKDVVEFGNPDSFDFGTTQPITARDVDTVLDDWVSSLSGASQELCVVMYGEQSIKTLERHWRSPTPIVILDLEAAWHQRHDGVVHSTLEEVASASEDIANATSTLDHAGNRAYCLLALLISLGRDSQESHFEEQVPDE